jgi:ABC-type multidrug transport system permease subunit
MYSPVPFAIAQILVEVPYCLLQTLVFGTITYALISYHWTAYKFLMYILFTFLTLLFFIFFGQMSVAISADGELKAFVVTAADAIWFLFAGFFLPYGAMPVWWQWFYWVNPLAYLLYGVITRWANTACVSASSRR